MATLLLEKHAPARAAASQPAPVPRQQDSFHLERGLALMLIGVAAVYLRAHDPLYSTAYMDESVYVVYGRMFLARHFEAPLATPLQWSFGWYLWPMLAALADRLGGLLALRELSALLGTLTVAATYGFASRVFSKTVGLGAAAVMAVLGPAVMVSRIATRDSGSICFFALGLWAFACAWRENKKRHWALAALAFFAAFLCKYLVAIYFPVLVLAALWKGRKQALVFAAPLFAACAAYAVTYWADLTHLLRYGGGYNSLRAADALSIYIFSRWDFWLIVGLAMFGLAHRAWWRRSAAMFAGALIVLAFQGYTRADYDYWKHVNYALFFLVPAAVAGALLLVRMLTPRNHHRQLIWGVSGVLALALGAGMLGKVDRQEQWLFWPGVDPALAYLEGKLTAQDSVLVDDTVFRYYLNPMLRQAQITDPMYAQYREFSGEEAYKAAVRDNAFSYVVLDGGMGAEAQRMNEVVRPMLAGYKLDFYAMDPVLGHKIEIYSRAGAVSGTATTNSSPELFVVSPPTGAVVNTASAADLMGVTVGAQSGWYVKVEVFTDRWHTQGEAVPVAPDGRFRQKIVLGGEGPQQCSHLVRATLFDGAGKPRATTLNYGIGRAGCSAQAAL
ncbi:MAG TPA: glycosyltransferase family 39 protein [Candidatus Angelobacter sp.]